jgi:hypothetical protein
MNPQWKAISVWELEPGPEVEVAPDVGVEPDAVWGAVWAWVGVSKRLELKMVKIKERIKYPEIRNW